MMHILGEIAQISTTKPERIVFERKALTQPVTSLEATDVSRYDSHRLRKILISNDGVLW